jgi:hypothetical protein
MVRGRLPRQLRHTFERWCLLWRSQPISIRCSCDVIVVGSITDSAANIVKSIRYRPLTIHMIATVHIAVRDERLALTGCANCPAPYSGSASSRISAYNTASPNRGGSFYLHSTIWSQNQPSTAGTCSRTNGNRGSSAIEIARNSYLLWENLTCDLHGWTMGTKQTV